MVCKQCQSPFEIAPEDLAFYDKLSPVFGGRKYPLPEPTLCPECQLKRRFCFRNQFLFYKRPSSLSGKSIVSVYSPDKPDVVYGYDEWWSDSWDPMDYGREFDFNRPFFEQFHELFRAVPKIHLIQDGTSENSDYTNFGAQNKNCYLTVGFYCEDVCYSYAIQSKDCLDCFMAVKNEKTVECVDCAACYNSFYLQNCQQCSDSWFLENCVDCQHCLGCKNLKNKKYHIFNKPYSEEEYNRLADTYPLDTHSGIQAFKKEFGKFKLTLPFKFAKQRMTENSSGDFLDGAKNCSNCFDVVGGAENCRNSVVIGLNCHDLMSCSNVSGSLDYESDGLLNGQRVLFSHFMRNCSDSLYSMFCYNSSNLFGCAGLRRKQYCILNKQYSKEEYETLVPKMIEYMKNPPHPSAGSRSGPEPSGPKAGSSQSSEWGEFFPVSMSPFGYNESMAYEYFPMEKSEARQKGYNWSDFEAPLPQMDKIIPADQLPESIQGIPDDILNWAIECGVTKKPFKIIPQELKFYREHHLPIPRHHPYQRHLDRLKQRNPYRLWARACAKCGSSIQTTYSPDRPEIVYCEKCYLAEVY